MNSAVDFFKEFSSGRTKLLQLFTNIQYLTIQKDKVLHDEMICRSRMAVCHGMSVVQLPSECF